VTFHLRNDQFVVLDYFVGSKEFYLSALLIASFTLGAILGMLAGLPIFFKLNRDNAKIAKKLKLCEKEINNLRVIPVKEPV